MVSRQYIHIFFHIHKTLIKHKILFPIYLPSLVSGIAIRVLTTGNNKMKAKCGSNTSTYHEDKDYTYYKTIFFTLLDDYCVENNPHNLLLFLEILNSVHMSSNLELVIYLVYKS